MRLPGFFLLGAARSGTTSLAGVLRDHPDVFIPDIKEPSFFAESFQWISNPVDYADLYADASDTLPGDASHIYLEDPSSARTIRAFCPDAKFIVVLRNPADRALALYSMMLEHGHEPWPTFEQALAAEERRFRSARFRRRCRHSFWNYMYFRSGLYAEQLERYFAEFPEDRFYITTLPELVGRPGAVFGEICEFLDIDRQEIDALPRDGTSKGVKSAALQVADRRILKPLEYRRAPVSGVRRRLNEWNRTARPAMQPATRERLMDRYADSLDRLDRLVGIDLRRTA